MRGVFWGVFESVKVGFQQNKEDNRSQNQFANKMHFSDLPEVLQNSFY